MTKCNECDVVDLGVVETKTTYEVVYRCPNCGAEDSVEEIDELEWAEDMALADADFQNELLEEEDYE